MSELVSKLKEQHEEILKVLDNVKNVGVASKEGQEKLLAAKNGLIEHLRVEDEEFYKVLRKAAESDMSLSQTLEIFAKDMDRISEQALSFFDKYAHGGSGIDFARDFGSLYAILVSRIRKEENVLFPAYEKYKDKA